VSPFRPAFVSIFSTACLDGAAVFAVTLVSDPSRRLEAPQSTFANHNLSRSFSLSFRRHEGLHIRWVARHGLGNLMGVDDRISTRTRSSKCRRASPSPSRPARSLSRVPGESSSRCVLAMVIFELSISNTIAAECPSHQHGPPGPADGEGDQGQVRRLARCPQARCLPANSQVPGREHDHRCHQGLSIQSLRFFVSAPSRYGH
jgi:hypothetical protein